MSLWDDEKQLGFHLRMALFFHPREGEPRRRVEIPEQKIAENLKEALKRSGGDVDQALKLLEEKLIDLSRRA